MIIVCGESSEGEFNGAFESFDSVSEANGDRPAPGLRGRRRSAGLGIILAARHSIFLLSNYSHTLPSPYRPSRCRHKLITYCRLSRSLSIVVRARRVSRTNMPPIRSSRNRKPPPDGFEDIEDTLLEFSNKLKDAENASHEGKKKQEMVWPVFQITHQRT